MYGGDTREESKIKIVEAIVVVERGTRSSICLIASLIPDKHTRIASRNTSI